MDKKSLQEQFEQTKTYELCKSWQIDFDEKAEIYYSINPAYHNDVIALNAAWSMFQEQQAKVEELEGKLKQAYEDVDTFAEAHERECGFKAQLAKDKAELQKRVDSIREVLDELQEQADVIRKRGQKFRDSNFLASADMMDICIKEIEQVLKGEG